MYVYTYITSRHYTKYRQLTAVTSTHRVRLNVHLFPYLVPVRTTNKGTNVTVAVCQI